MPCNGPFSDFHSFCHVMVPPAARKRQTAAEAACSGNEAPEPSPTDNGAGAHPNGTPEPSTVRSRRGTVAATFFAAPPACALCASLPPAVRKRQTAAEAACSGNLMTDMQRPTSRRVRPHPMGPHGGGGWGRLGTGPGPAPPRHHSIKHRGCPLRWAPPRQSVLLRPCCYRCCSPSLGGERRWFGGEA